MSNRLDKYLQGVAHELRGLKPEHREPELREMRGHLESIVARLVEDGLSEAEAVTVATAQFGTARTVGRQLKQAGVNSEEWWRIVLAPLGGASAFVLGWKLLLDPLAEGLKPWVSMSSPLFPAVLFFVSWLLCAAAVRGCGSGGRLDLAALGPEAVAGLVRNLPGGLGRGAQHGDGSGCCHFDRGELRGSRWLARNEAPLAPINSAHLSNLCNGGGRGESSMVRERRPRRRAGFTLIEMLIVLGIVVLLAGLLLPVLGIVRDRSRLASCSSNLHQIHLALSQYSNDNSGLLPPYPSLVTASGTRRPASSTCVEQSRELVSSLFFYARSNALWRCPSDSRPTAPRTSTCGDGASLVAGNATSYSYQGWEWSEDEMGISPVRLDTARGDASHRPLAEDDASCSSGSGTQFGLYNHGGRWNRVFFDGHAKTFSRNCSDPGRPIEE